MDVGSKPNHPTQISASAQIKAGPGMLEGIFVSSASNTPTIKVWDNTAGSGNVLIDTFTPVSGTYYNFGRSNFVTGCYVTTSGTVSCTILSR